MIEMNTNRQEIPSVVLEFENNGKLKRVYSSGIVNKKQLLQQLQLLRELEQANQ